MAAAKLKAYWDQDIYDHHILVIEKNRGKLNQDEVLELLRYEKSGAFQGNYVHILRAGEATCGVDWGFEEEPKGDEWVLYQVEEMENCPVCHKLSSMLQYCPECGKELIAKPDAERGIRSQSKAILDAIIRTNLVNAQDEEGCLRILDGILKEVLK